MNFIYLALSVFVANYIAMYIVRLLPIKNKRIVQLVVVSILDIGSIIGYIVNLVSYGFELSFFLYTVGNIIGISVAYVASLMLILDDVQIFKSRRAREFERGIKNKEGSSVPRNILASICFIVFIVLIVYGIIALLNYSNNLLLTTIGVFVAATISLALAIYFLISGRPTHKKISAQKLLFMIQLPQNIVLYEAELTKEFTINDALGALKDIYILDEFGLLCSPTASYLVQGMKLNELTDDIKSKIHMKQIEHSEFLPILNEFNKYQRKKIILDENNQIVQIKNIK
ncbi:MAG: hypothetical protein K2O05_00735 [Anaeroplasmataceae bacterium]|nr:hypothetical protein [Anaeroplasmataceae bacterium]